MTDRPVQQRQVLHIAHLGVAFIDLHFVDEILGAFILACERERGESRGDGM